ncbi:hypothetical protein [Streptomyces californicus]|uniref:hypothetical protein n=1 Tax=Streptomyces californicus TaxID=67351 RepID=UPI003724348D
MFSAAVSPVCSGISSGVEVVSTGVFAVSSGVGRAVPARGNTAGMGAASNGFGFFSVRWRAQPCQLEGKFVFRMINFRPEVLFCGGGQG